MRLIHTTVLLLGIVAFGAGCTNRNQRVTVPSAPVQRNPVSSAPAAPVAQLKVPIPDDLALSQTVANAVQTLANAPAFGGEAVGYSGAPNAEVASLRSILADSNAAAALQLVIEHGTLPAQLMAVSGLYYIDPDGHGDRVQRYSAMTDTVPMVTGGCMSGTRPVAVAKLVRAPGAIRLKGPTESFQQWAGRYANGPITLDIAGGGYPSTLTGR